jgi:hypothetical protein
VRSTPSRSPVHADVFSHLPVLLMRALDTDETAALVDDLLAAGWRPGQLRHRVGAEPARGSVEGDAAGVLELLRALHDVEPPDAAHAREVQRRRLDREHADALAPPPASPEVRAAAIAQIRSGLKGAPRRRPEPVPRTRPACSLCAGEGRYFVTRDVHLCARCVEVMATGRARISRTG